MGLIALVGLVAAFTATHYSRPSLVPFSGRLKVARITKLFFEQGTVQNKEKSITITNAQDLAQLEDAAKAVPQDFFGSNSCEEFPKYQMEVTYIDGRTEQFRFSRTEWGFRGHTPTLLVNYLDEHGL